MLIPFCNLQNQEKNIYKSLIMRKKVNIQMESNILPGNVYLMQQKRLQAS